jgi:hypothetical protein
MSTITFRKFTGDENPATLQSAIECLVASFSTVEATMTIFDNKLEILQMWYTLNVQRALESAEPGEAYMAFDEDKSEDGASKVVGIASWKAPKERGGDT